VPRDDATVVTVMIGFKVGSRDEDDKDSGVSHFLEHMAYKGTTKRPTPQSIAEFIDGLGAGHNAFTAKDHTGYYVKLSPDHITDAFDFLSDIVINSTIPEVEVEKERNVILEEIKMYEDMPMYLAAEEFEKAVHQDGDLARLIIGTRDTVKHMTREQILEYKSSHYFANNAVLLIVGNLGDKTEQELTDLTEKYFTLQEKAKSAGKELRTKSVKKLNIINKKTEQSNLVIGFPACGIEDEDYYAVKLMAKILGGSMSSRMWTHVRENLCLAYEIETGYSSFLGEGYVATYAGVSNDKVEKATEAILHEYNAMKSGDISDSEIARAKEIIKGRILIDVEDSGGIAHDFLYDELMLGEIEPYNIEIEKFNSVTKDDITRVANKFLDLSKIVFSGVGPEIADTSILSLLK